MEFPVDVLDGTGYEELELSAHAYMNKLLYSDPDHPQRFTLGSGRKVQISLSSVGFVPLHGANVQHKVLALFTPQDQFTAVALFLANQWYSVEDILKTANPTREGLVEVRSVGERIVLYTLNRIVYRTSEMATGELPFLCHGETAYAKILWKSGEAVGFYSVKTKGSICSNSLRQCYFLPVMDSIFVRKAHQGRKHGFQMLEDFVDSFKENELGLKYPLTPAMARVCRHYLDRYPADVDLLWEVEGVGGPYQRTRIAKKLSFWPVNADIYEGGHGEDSDRSEALEEDRAKTTEDAVLDITEEVLVADNSCKTAEDISTPISTRTRSSEQRMRKRRRDEVEESWVEVWPKKIKRVEMAKEQDEWSVPSYGSGLDSSTTEGNNNAVDTSDEPAAANVNMASEKHQEEVVEVELYPIARVHKIEESLFLAEEEGVAEEKLEDKIVSTVEVVRAGEQNKVSLAEEEMELAPEEQHDVTPVAEKEKEADYIALMQIETAPVAQEENEATSAGKEKQEITPMVQEKKGAAEKQMEAGLAAKEEKEVAPATMEMKAAFAVEEQIEAAPSVKEMDAAPAPEELEAAPAAEELEAAPAAEELEAAPAAEELEAAPAAEELEAAPAAEELEAAPAAEELEATPAAEEMVVAPTADQMQTAPAVTEETQAAPAAKERAVTPVADQTQTACADREEMQAAPATEERVVAPAVRKETQAALAVDDKQGVTPIAEKELEMDDVAVDQMVVPTVKEAEEAALAATEKLQKGTLAKHEFKASSPAKEKGFVPANVEKKKVRAEPNQENCVSFASQEVKEVICATEETSNITASEGEQGHNKDIYAANDVDEEIFVTFDLPSDGESQGSLEKEDEQEHGSVETPNFQDLQEPKIKVYPSTLICASKRLCKGDLEPEEKDEVVDRQKKAMVRDAKGAGAAEDKLEEIEHSSVEEEQEENPPVIERRVLRRKTRVVQAKLRSKAKRHSKI